MVATPATVFNSKQVQCRHHHKHLFGHQIPTTNDSHFIQLDANECIASTGQLPFPYFPTRITPGQSPTQRLCPTSRRMNSYDTIHLHFLTMWFSTIFATDVPRQQQKHVRHHHRSRATPQLPRYSVNSSTHSQIFIQQLHRSKVLDIKQHRKLKTTVSISYNEARDRRSKSLLRDRIVESFVAPFNTNNYHFP